MSKIPAQTNEHIPLINAVLSPERMSTYENAVNSTPEAALALYEWNAEISAAFLLPQHICEVATRNAAAAVLAQVFGSNWPWSAGLERSLPNPGMAYSMRMDLLRTREKISVRRTGKVIPELAIKFWVNLFTARFDQRLWEKHLLLAFPHLPPGLTVAQARLSINMYLDRVRMLRNRIAHHEPIFSRDLRTDYACARNLIAWRCRSTATWLDSLATIDRTLALRP